MTFFSKLNKFVQRLLQWGIKPSDRFSFRVRMRLLNLILLPVVFIVHPLVGFYYLFYLTENLPAYMVMSVVIFSSFYLLRKRLIDYTAITLNVGITLGFIFAIMTGETQQGGMFTILSAGVLSFYIIMNKTLRIILGVVNFVSFYVLLYYQLNVLVFDWGEYAILGFAIFFLFALLSFFTDQKRRNELIIDEQKTKLGQQNEELISQAEELQALDEAKTHFFNNISHEFRTPLTLLLGIIQQVQEEESSNPKIATLLDIAHKQGHNLKHLVDQILNIAKLEKQQEQLRLIQGDIIPYLRGFTMSFESMAASKQITLSFKSEQKQITMPFDQEVLMKVMNNLISNAIKFTKKDGTISVIVKENLTTKQLVVAIKDTGIGIPPNDLPHIFDRFYQSANTTSGGTGIGLALVKELLALHQGNITVSSQLAEGTTFTFTLPLTIDTYTAQEAIQELAETSILLRNNNKQYANIESSESQLFNAKKSQKPILLLVEDNSDLHYLMQAYLENDYQLLHAYDGKEGITQAIEHSPDLIISDVMMPEASGYELCTTLKDDERTSHIPIVLLSAKAEINDRITGLTAQADDYLAKPFDKQELLIRVHNLIETRKQLRERYSDSINFKSKKITRNPKDQAFLDRALKTLETHYQQERFNVQQFSEEMHLGTRQLNRKIKALINQSSVQFIQSFRLQKAVELLQNGDLQISEIAHQVGFSSSPYFIKCFKDKFNKTPKEYQEGLINL